MGTVRGECEKGVGGVGLKSSFGIVQWYVTWGACHEESIGWRSEKDC